MCTGTITALATPFDARGEVDFPALQQMIADQIESGIDGIVLGGTTGEAPTLTDEELVEIWRLGVACAERRVPIIAGTGTNCTRRTVDLTQQAQAVGVDGCLVIVPYYNRPTPEGCYAHYEAVSRVGLPMIVYHHPGRCGIRLPVSMLAQISRLPSVVGIKEASGDLDFTGEVIRASAQPVLASDDGLVLPILALGGAGVVSIVSNLIPQIWKEVVTLFCRGLIAEAKCLFDRYEPLVQAMVLETNPQCVKYALSLMGKCSAGMRLPLIEPREETKRQIVHVLAQMEMAGVNGSSV
jgi:4-hydroxy-tetrahydrodipicolinate synthase